MASNGGKKACAVIASIILLPLAIGLFAAMIGLGAWGIVQAQVANPCAAQNNETLECVPSSSILVIGEMPNNFISLGWTYWLGGATGVGVVWAVVMTCAGAALIAAIALFDDKDNTQNIPMSDLTHAGEHTDGGENDGDSDSLELKTVTVGGDRKAELKAKPVQSLTFGAGVGLFVSLLFLALGILCLLWSIAISYDHARRDNGSVATYVVVEFIAAIALPICLFISGIFLAAVLNFVSRGHADLRMYIPKFLPVVKFETGVDHEGTERDYWVIEDTFYFEVKRREKNSFLDSFDRSLSTWFLNGIVCLGIHLAFAYFVDFTIDTQTTIESPDRCDTIDSTYQCYFAGNLSSTRCGIEFVNGTLHCFKFLRFGVDFDLIMAISSAYAFYLVASTAFTYLFSVVKIILQIKPSKWWGLGFFFFGLLGILGGIILAIVWFYGYAASQVEEILHFNIINIAQYFMVCVYIMMVGLLLVIAKWWENQPTKKKVTRNLVHYEDTSRGEVAKAAKEHAADKESEAVNT